MRKYKLEYHLPTHLEIEEYQNREGIFLSRKSKEFLPGYIFVPYQIVTGPAIINDGRFYPKKALLARFSTKMINNKFYGKISHATGTNTK